MRVGVDGIALDAPGEWLYLSPLNGHTLWRRRAGDLVDPTPDAELGKAARTLRYQTQFWRHGVR